MNFPILSVLTILPLLGAAFIATLRGSEAVVAKNARWTALWTTLVTFAVSLLLVTNFDASNSGFQFVERFVWFAPANIYYVRGIDGIALWFVLASSLLTLAAILCSWKSIETRVPMYHMALMVLLTMMIGVFSSLDLILLFVFFEGVLLPMFFIIGIWGGARRIYSSYKFFLYTMLGSLFMLLAMLTIYVQLGSTELTTLFGHHLPMSIQVWLFAAFFLSFAIKSPMWPVHTWLPDAHVEAPTAGSVILAGILLKMGGYGFMRFCIQLLPEASQLFAPLVMILSAVAIIYTSLVALAQSDMKKMIAYSSVAHMGFVTLGLFSFTHQGLDGAMLVMLSHTIVSAALFLCIGVMYDRLHTREISAYGGLASIMPNFAVVVMIFTMASVGLPGTSGFVGEFLSMLGAWQAAPTITLFAAIGVILGAAYMLKLYRGLFFGVPATQDVRRMRDLTVREMIVFAPLLVLVIWMGVHPTSFSHIYQANITAILNPVSTGAAQ
ncbi:MAG TPA: NADH-quinone oxidoreductase subunit M [Alphaproteobacteria bacterium]|nr:NADH-quinone oxidoreductase subunit M [Rhodospirillaceae bacterium]HRJ12251.1 NADH-quinone oxidoreductase subunit M [Alphaproteobacteria bacterium]